MNEMIKDGDIKVNSNDVIKIFEAIDFCNKIISNNIQILSESDKKIFETHLDTVSLLHTKYLKLSDIRVKQHLMYEVLKIIDNKKYDNDLKESENEEVAEQVIKAMSNNKDEYFELYKNIIFGSNNLPENIYFWTGLMIRAYGYDKVRRWVWGEYIELKGMRENIIHFLKKE